MRSQHRRFQTKNSRNSFPVLLLRVILVGFYLSACRYPSVTPTPGIIPTFVTLPPTTSLPPIASPSTSTNTPVIETLTAQASITAVSPTPCGAPVGWVRYTIRPGDSLSQLSLKTNTTVEEIQLANCLTEDLIFTGDPLYLPFAPPTDIPIPPTAIQRTLCPSILSCSTPGLDPLVLAPAGPNNPTFTPCAPNDSNKIQAASLRIELGERLYFFACNFPSPPVSAVVILENGTIQSAELLDPNTVNRDLITSTVANTPTGPVEYKAQAVIGWAAVPVKGAGAAQPTGTHTVLITYGNGNREERKFKVNPPREKHILVVPPVGAPGTTFQVYYVYFDLNTNPTVESFGETQPSTVPGDHKLTHRGQWMVPITEPLPGITGKGWAQLLLSSASTDLRAAYAISYNRKQSYTLFWLE